MLTPSWHGHHRAPTPGRPTLTPAAPHPHATRSRVHAFTRSHVHATRSRPRSRHALTPHAHACYATFASVSPLNHFLLPCSRHVVNESQVLTTALAGLLRKRASSGAGAASTLAIWLLPRGRLAAACPGIRPEAHGSWSASPWLAAAHWRQRCRSKEARLASGLG